MEIRTIQYTEDGGFVVNKGGGQLHVPDDMGNRHRVIIQKWMDAGGVVTPYVPPVLTWDQNRQANIVSGGYGTSAEQFEILGEQGIGAYQIHINAVKARYPKP